MIDELQKEHDLIVRAIKSVFCLFYAWPQNGIYNHWTTPSSYVQPDGHLVHHISWWWCCED